MKIVADKDIPLVEHLCSGVGEVSGVDGRRIDNTTIRDADVLIVRTITRVSEELLHGSRVSVVASATSGVDHVDLEYLRGNGIAFFHAAGANARPVAEYVLSALCVLAGLDGYELRNKRIGIIGCGNVGSLVLHLLETMGADCVVNDPPLLEQTGDTRRFRDLEELMCADIISLHVPLQDEGPCATRNMVNRALLGKLRPDVVLINTSRGGVVDEKALVGFLHANPQARAVLDVWNDEPVIDTELLRRAVIGTPHIAGYSLEGKLRASQMICRQVCAYLAADYHDTDAAGFDEMSNSMAFANIEDEDETLRFAVLAGYDVRGDSAALRRILEVETGDRGAYFDDLRRASMLRREFSAMTIGLPAGQSQLRDKLAALGFRVAP